MLEAIREETLPTRRKIVDAALLQVAAQGHYLTGCFGARPGGRDTVRRRSLELGRSLEWDSLAIYAAEHRNLPRDEPLRCAGRYEHAGGREIGDSALQRRIRDYIEANRDTDPEQWPQFEGSGYPRKAWDEFRGRYFYVLGEDCRGKPHFDCIGFVNWAISETMQRPVTYSSSQWASRTAPVTVVEGTPQERNLEPGDLLIRTTGVIPHIVIVGYEHQLIEAAGIRAGVVISRFDPSRFGFHSRIRNSWLGRA